MKLHLSHLQRFLPDLSWDIETLATNLSMIGHEAEVIGDALEVKIFPNRGDVLSLRGLSRDLAALYPEIGEWRDVEVATLPEPSEFFKLNIAADASAAVLSDHLLRIEGYTPTKSPSSVTDLLKPLGLQPKELLIDLTNIITYEVGVPLHSFDFDKVADGMTIRLSRQDEEFAALNKNKVVLPSGLLVAENVSGELTDLLGTMGGNNSAVGPATVNVLLQAGAFEPKAVRRNSRFTNIATEASYRYQRGVDPALMPLALARFVFLLRQSLQVVDVTGYQALNNYESPEQIPISPKYVTDLLGVEVSGQNIINLKLLGFSVDEDMVTPPTWRFDILNAADVAEDVARQIGLNNIKPKQLSKSKKVMNKQFENILNLKHSLSTAGFTETLTYSFTKEGPVTLQNPRTPEQGAMRSSLEEGLLRTVAKNPFLPKSLFFEVGAVFLPEESQYVGVVVSGLKEKQLDPVRAKLENILGTSVELNPVAQERLSKFDVKQSRVYFVEFPIDKLSIKERLSESLPLSTYRPVSKFPPIVRDVTLSVDSIADQSVVQRCLANHELVLLAELVDEYRSDEQLGADRVAVTYRLILQHMERSLTDAEAANTIEAVFHNLSDKVKFEQR